MRVGLDLNEPLREGGEKNSREQGGARAQQLTDPASSARATGLLQVTMDHATVSLSA